MAVTLTWYGHATLGLEVNGCRILVDPFFSGNPTATVSADKVAADYILVSHGHGDHIGDTVPIAKRTGATVITNFEVGNWLVGKGLKKVHQQHIGGGFQHPFGYLKLTLALHGSALPDGSYGGNPAGFLLSTSEGKKLYLAGDTGLFGDMKLIGEEGIDLAVLPIGDNFTMGPEDALRAVKLINPRHVVPIHFSTFDLISQDAESWAKRVSTQTSAQVHILKPGDHFALP
jgi:L-ascorbate metabolism protein UlaG (beta-lactamase superfamily)